MMVIFLHQTCDTKQQTRKRTMTKTQEISRQILVLVASGMDVVEAMKQVCGADAVDSMITTLYNELRAK